VAEGKGYLQCEADILSSRVGGSPLPQDTQDVSGTASEDHKTRTKSTTVSRRKRKDRNEGFGMQRNCKVRKVHSVFQGLPTVLFGLKKKPNPSWESFTHPPQEKIIIDESHNFQFRAAPGSSRHSCLM